MSRQLFTVQELSIGAQICDLEAREEYDEETRRALYDAWLKYGVLTFTNINSIEEHLSLSRCFGELEPHPMVDQRSKEHPLMLELGGDRKQRTRALVYDSDIRLNRVPWHRDTAYTRDICKGAMLRLLELPAYEGHTMFADSAKAYDDLSDAMKERLEGLEYRTRLYPGPVSERRRGAFWNTARWASDEEDPGAPPVSNYEDLVERFPDIVHPAVLAHPESGRKGIFLSPKDFLCFLGMDRAESDALMDQLVSHLLSPKYVYVHRWQLNQAVLWDNRRILHAAAGNAPDQPRWGLRTTLAGPVRTGRFFTDDPKTAAA